MKARKLILRNGQSPGEIVMLTAAVRDLKRALGAAVAVDVRTPCPALWENSPHLTPLADGAAGAEEIACGYPPVHRSNRGPWHFIHGFTRFLAAKNRTMAFVLAVMKLLCLFTAILLANPVASFALSAPIGRDINFPKDYDPARVAAIRAVIGDERFKFLGGTVSYWQPDFGTRLSFTGDAASLNEFIAALRKLPGIGMRVILYRGRNDELRRDSAWQLDFSQARPDQLTIYLNLNAEGFVFDQVKLPDWPPATP
jgi:hypothetical protein